MCWIVGVVVIVVVVVVVVVVVAVSAAARAAIVDVVNWYFFAVRWRSHSNRETNPAKSSQINPLRLSKKQMLELKIVVNPTSHKNRRQHRIRTGGLSTKKQI